MSKALVTQGKITIKQVCALDVTADKKRISPIGEVEGIDGRTFNVDAQSLLDVFVKNGLEIVLNVDHEYTSKHGSEACGWFTDFEERNNGNRDDGIYAALELNELGTELIDAKKYKYLSPEYLTDNRGNVTTIVGVGLVNQPNLLNESLNHLQIEQENTMTPEEIEALKASNAQLKTANETLSAKANDLTTKVDELATEARVQKVDNAIQKGDLKPAKKEFALTLDANSLDKYLTLEAAQPAKKENNNLQHGQSTDDDDDLENCAIAKQFGL